ncbi:hypothetical protein PAXRUDRAFT_465508 [Paxillus rubicundulus Ve08.2h10]|uniref:Glycerophosphocholine acyltransferase 1 n=1 Tax=Paxillus rubicundulus Ve08.2h10 TaxID=930991 RepID=A0A0D0DLY6_9AGAM|nr:hypothetical protein PAXRUDRAFT_465508 [Paxillus rubicundulus Ve08.2h10]
METYFDSHLDLLQRQIQKHSDKLKMKAEVALKRRTQSSDNIAENFDREIRNFKLKVSSRMQSLVSSWHSAKVVRTREKVSFFCGVMSVLVSALLFGMAPQWVHIAYTLQGLYFLPVRAYIYKKRLWHYFLFDLCYYVTILNFIYIWFFPSNTALFMACYCLSHGSLASAVITWRNSLVFHDSDKVTSLFVHIYAPFTFTVIRHYYPGAGQRFPALAALPYLSPGRALLISGAIYLIWQLLYWKFVLVDRRTKIESGERTTSFSFLLNDKHGAIGRALVRTRPERRTAYFMGGQFLYSILTELPAVYLLYDSPRWSGSFLILIFAVSVWNGGGFYIEVFGRKFERELEALRKELAENSSRSGRSSPTLTDAESVANTPHINMKSLPPADDSLANEDDPSVDKKDL